MNLTVHKTQPRQRPGDISAPSQRSDRVQPEGAVALPRHRAATSTPVRVRLFALAVVLATAALAALLAVEVRQERADLHTIGHQSAPLVVASTDLSFALNDMDAQLANMLLVGDEQHLGFTRTQASAIYEQRRAQASRDLQQAAVAAADPVTARIIRDVLDALGHYEALAAQTMLLDEQAGHPAGQPSAGALARYRQATDLLKSSLLPAARALTDRNAQHWNGLTRPATTAR